MLFLSLSHQKKEKKKEEEEEINYMLHWRLINVVQNNVIFSNDNSIQPCDLLADTIIWLNLTEIPKGTAFKELYLGFTHWKSSDSTQT